MSAIKNILFFSILFLSIPLQAQVPGYLGKRFLAGFSLNTAITFLAPSASNRGYGQVMDLFNGAKPSFALSNRYNLDLEYVTFRNASLGLSVSSYKTGFARTILIDRLNSSTLTNEFFFQINSLSFELKFKKYNLKRGAIAPLGAGFSWGIFVNFSNANIKDRINENDEAIDIPSKTSIYTYGLVLESSKNITLNDDFFLKYGYSIRLPFNVYSILNADSDNRYDYNPYVIENSTLLRVLVHDIFSFNVGVAYLIK